ncbi:MAG: hypothetical protein IJ831_09430 [Spirochaetales bacterium]|nr:hypothetical protein [Spirochaetales bacterium]
MSSWKQLDLELACTHYLASDYAQSLLRDQLVTADWTISYDEETSGLTNEDGLLYLDLDSYTDLDASVGGVVPTRTHVPSTTIIDALVSRGSSLLFSGTSGDIYEDGDITIANLTSIVASQTQVVITGSSTLTITSAEADRRRGPVSIRGRYRKGA